MYGRLEDLLLSCHGSSSFWTDCQGGFWVRRSLHRTKSRTQGRGLESQFGQGPGHLGQEGNGLVLLVPGVQAGRVFLGYPAGGIDSRIAGRSGTACFVASTVVRTER